MTKNDCDTDHVAGPLRSALGEQKATLEARRPGSGMFNRMPTATPEPRPEPPELPAPRCGVGVPTMRQRLRVAGVVMPLIVAVTGLGSAYAVLDSTRSLPIAVVCAGLGIVGAVFCHVLLRDRVEVG